MSKVLIEKEGNIAVVYMNNLDKKNALDESLSSELLESIKKLAEDESIYVVILTSAGDVFCAGGDIKEFAEGVELTALEHYSKKNINVDVLRIVDILKKPLIAAVSGYALGGGFGLVANAHIVVSHPDTRFGLTEINLGILPYVIFPYVKRAVGEREAILLTLMGKTISSQEAYRIGLVHFIDENPLKKAKEIASQIAQKSPLILKLLMDMINVSHNPSSCESEYLSLLRIVNFSAQDLKIGIESFLNKQKPQWKNK
ncbi:methylglutaconyl-CoA hydratase [Desulfurella multipotens]|uniref:Methylglutaconyl-CoA hydratase n=2 Tax=Desulfurella TaxID=33001 RepID=A0A1G6RFP8_9BACT|nr:enoyl-CoA hydratase/isomerase family protein [Desulfurella multipotens]SDD03271.1 methylglutaconyl-CoA hydratase [Desulfurella multipotens]